MIRSSTVLTAEEEGDAVSKRSPQIRTALTASSLA